MTPKQARFHRLVRHFLDCLVDSEMMAAGAEPHKTLVSALALLGALGFTLTLMLTLRYAFRFDQLAPHTLRWALFSDQLFLLLLNFTVAGFLAVLAWDSIFPGRRDAFVLGALPVPRRALTGARLYSLGLYFALFTFALNVLPGLLLPALQRPGGSGPVAIARAFAAQFIAIALAAGFVFAAAIALQGALLLLLPWRWFERASAVCQTAWLLAAFAVFFLTPDVVYAARRAQGWAPMLPPFWFLDLWQTLAGAERLFVLPLAARAWLASGLAFGLALATLLWGYPLALRKAVEGREPRRAGPGLMMRAWTRLLNATLLRRPRERAVFWFAARTLARHRGHRLLLCVYIGLALAGALWNVSSLLYGAGQWSRPSAATGVVLFLLTLLPLIGMRALFALPVEPRANQVFRLAGGDDTAALVGGARKLMLAAGCAPLLLLAPVYAALWGWRPALWFVLFAALVMGAFAEWLMRNFGKVPFACTWLPGQANLRVKLGLWAIAFTSFTSFAATAGTFLAVYGSAGQRVFWYGVPAVWWLFQIWRRRGAAPPPVYEERPVAEVMPLELSA